MNNVVSLGTRSSRIVPKRLREAREALELSMEEVGSRIGKTRQAISMYEAGEREPDPATIVLLVRELRQPIAYFTSERPGDFGPRGTTFFRSFKSKTKRTNKRCEILSDWFVQTTAFFSKFVKLPQVALPVLEAPVDGAAYSDGEIEEAATSCRRFWGLGDGPIANVVSLLESKGVTVARVQFDAEAVSAFSFWEGGRPFIFLAADKESAARSRFDSAHELGHLVLHRGVTEEDLESDLDRIEREANRFASAFLLPEATYSLEVFSTRLAAFVELKKRWRVSVAAQIYRCADLGILSDDHVLNLRKQISAARWRKREPLDDTIPVEKPTMIEKCLRLLIEKGVQSGADILAALRLSRETLEALISTTIPFSEAENVIESSVPMLR